MAKSIQLLDGLGQDQVRRLLSAATRRRFVRREVIFHEGDPAQALHLIDGGRVALRISTALGEVVTLDVLGRGAVFGELALLTPDAQRSATAVALEPTETMMVSAGEFALLRKSHPSINDVLLGILAARNRELNDRLAEALYVPVETRLARRLLGVAGTYQTANQPTVKVPLTQEDLAGLTGTTRETVNRILQRFQTDGVIELNRGSVSVLDLKALTRLAR